MKRNYVIFKINLRITDKTITQVNIKKLNEIMHIEHFVEFIVIILEKFLLNAGNRKHIL